MIKKSFIPKMPSFDGIISEKDLEEIRSDILEDIADDVYENIMKEGVGVYGGTNPSGGAPVWIGDPKRTTYYPGALKESHNKNYERKDLKKITINRSIFYVDAVINGHDKVKPNPYHKRALDTTIKSGVVNEIIQKNFEKHMGLR